MSEHTPTPWVICPDEPKWIITTVDHIKDDIICEMSDEALIDSNNWTSDAAFIVEACNNYDPMRSALQLVRKYMQEDVDHFGVELLTPENRAIWDAVNGALGDSTDAKS
jgi:hypothetical protein